MKTLLNILLALTVAVTPALADAKVKAGPRKGRILEMTAKNAEFFVEKDRTVSITFYDADMKAQAPDGGSRHRHGGSAIRQSQAGI